MMRHHLKANHISDAMHDCVENFSDCHDACTETLIHCLGNRRACRSSPDWS